MLDMVLPFRRDGPAETQFRPANNAHAPGRDLARDISLTDKTTGGPAMFRGRLGEGRVDSSVTGLNILAGTEQPDSHNTVQP
jgi:hypothetical protein